MSTVDEILATGRYTDKRGRKWEESYYSPKWKHRIGGILGEDYLWLTPAQMRMLIERDQHRDECPGLRWCLTHPVVNVGRNRLSKSWQVWGPGDWYRTSLGAFPEAMDAARALAVGE